MFFPLLLTEIEDKGLWPQQTLTPMLHLTVEEVEWKMFVAKPWKAPEDNSLPAMVWRQIWPVIKNRVLLLF